MYINYVKIPEKKKHLFSNNHKYIYRTKYRINTGLEHDLVKETYISMNDEIENEDHLIAVVSEMIDLDVEKNDYPLYVLVEVKILEGYKNE